MTEQALLRVAAPAEEEAPEWEDPGKGEEGWAVPEQTLALVVSASAPNAALWRPMRSEFPATTKTARSVEQRW